MNKLSLNIRPVAEKREIRLLRLCYKFKELIKPVQKYKAIRFLEKEFFEKYVNEYGVKQKKSLNGYWFYFSGEYCYFYKSNNRNDQLCFTVKERKINEILISLDRKIEEYRNDIYKEKKKRYYFDSSLYNAVNDIFSNSEYDLEKFEDVKSNILNSLNCLTEEVVKLNFSELLMKKIT